MTTGSPLISRFRWDYPRFCEAHNAFLRATLLRHGMLFPLLLALAIAATVALFVFDVASPWFRQAYAIAIGFVLLVTLLLCPPLQHLWLRRRWRARPDAGKEVEFQLGSEGVRSATEGIASSEIQWAGIHKAVGVRTGWLLYLTTRQYFYLPDAGYQFDSGAIAGARRADELVSAHVANVVRRGRPSRA